MTGLKNGTPVYFTVTADTLGSSVLPLAPLEGTSGPSNTVIPAGPPFTPTEVFASRGDGQVDVAWEPPARRPDGTPGDNGDPISGYTVTAFRASDNAEVASTQASVSPTTVVGLENGTAYYVKVRATNGVGTGPDSAASNTVTPAGPPFAPTNVTASAGNGVADVNWTASDDNGSPIISYIVTASPGGASDTVGGGATSATVSGLDNGTTYTLTVVATNDVGDSVPSAPSNAVTAVAPPSPPRFTSASPGDLEAYVSWQASQPNGSPITSYTVTASPSGASVTVAGDTTSATVGGLANGTTYTFTVVATNAIGASEPGAPSGPAIPSPNRTVPNPPTSVSATATGDGRATVTWTPSTSDTSFPVRSYTVHASSGSAQVTVEGEAASSADITGLDNGMRYTFTVAANNIEGDSPPSVSSNHVWTLENTEGGARLDALAFVAPEGATGLLPCIVASEGDRQQLACREITEGSARLPSSTVINATYFGLGDVSGGGNYQVLSTEGTLYEGCSYDPPADEWVCTSSVANERFYKEIFGENDAADYYTGFIPGWGRDLLTAAECMASAKEILRNPQEFVNSCSELVTDVPD